MDGTERNTLEATEHFGFLEVFRLISAISRADLPLLARFWKGRFWFGMRIAMSELEELIGTTVTVAAFFVTGILIAINC